MPQLVTIVGNSSSGKTTVIEKLIVELKRKGYRIGAVKHAHHGYDIDQKGKDSFALKDAGADIVLVSSPGKIMMIKDDTESESLDRLESYFQGVDLVIAEGFKKEPRPKVEVFRSEVHSKPLFQGNKELVAMVSDSDISIDVPLFRFHEIRKLSDFLENKFIKNIDSEDPDSRKQENRWKL
ncbi:MAG: molybdopterin-guanine dinucleotide biosynthesis protein B [Thermodesulfobacteriota bacterium]